MSITSFPIPTKVLPQASESADGIVRLAPPLGTSSGQAVQASDPRLSNARLPIPHSHPQSQVVGLAAALLRQQTARNVLNYGVVGDGVTVNTSALQSLLNDANVNGYALYFPAGTYKTGPLTYRGQSLMGDGPRLTMIQGLPGQDIFVMDPTAPIFHREHGVIEKMIFLIDDSIDNSAAYPTRGGVGNCCFAADYTDANSPLPISWHSFCFRDVMFRGINDDRTKKTACFWTQRIVYNTSFERCDFRSDYGFIIAAPNNLALTNTFGGAYDSFSNDHNTWRDCSLLCNTTAFQSINGQRCTMTNVQVYAGQKGARLLDFPNNQQNIGMWNVDMLFVEGCTVQSLKVEGFGHVFRNLNVSPNSGSAAHEKQRIDCIKSSFEQCTFYITSGYAGCNRIEIYGALNRIYRCQLVPDTIYDYGKGNTISFIDWTDAARPSSERFLSRNKLATNHFDGLAPMIGALGGAMPRNLSDLTIAPDDIALVSAGHTVVDDASLEFGRKIVLVDYFYASFVQTRQMRFGSFIPRGRVKLWMKVRRLTAGTVSKHLYVQNWTQSVSYGFKEVTYSDAWSVVSNECDCSGANIGDVAEIIFFAEAGVTTEIAWVAIQPLPDEVTGKRVLFPVAPEPAANLLHGGLLLWWDGTNLKAKKPDGGTFNLL
jgi:hypothetical protein